MTPTLEKIAVAAALAVTLAALFDIAVHRDEILELYPDHRLAGGKFWKTVDTHETDDYRPSIPYQLPGPMDAWAGGRAKEIRIHYHTKNIDRIELWLFDTHQSSPPVIRVEVNGKTLADVTLPRGAGVTPSQWNVAGKRSKVVVPIPGEPLDSPLPVIISLRSVAGSWAAFQKIVLADHPPSRDYFIAGLGAAFIGLWLAYKAIDAIRSRKTKTPVSPA